MESFSVEAAAKINLYLYVPGRRKDGYHELVSLMAKLELADTIAVSEADAADDFLKVSNFLRAPLGNQFTGPDNLALKAVAAFRERSGRPAGSLGLHLEKRIPLGAGLGGGSSNAAALLLALNEACGRPLSSDSLLTLGLSLGADVPFLMQPEAVRVCRGAGEIFAEPSSEELAWRGRELLLVNPGLHLPTSGVFKNLGLTKGEANTNLGRLSSPEIGFNELYEAALDLNGQLAEVPAALAATKPKAFGMSGSGSTFWAAYADGDSLSAAMARIAAAKPQWWLCQTRIV